MEAITLPVLECPKCGHVWVPRIPDPVTCPKCRVPVARWPKYVKGARNGMG